MIKNNNIELEIKKLSLTNNDLLIFKVNSKFKDSEAITLFRNSIENALKGYFEKIGYKNNILVIDSSVEMSIIKYKETME